MGKIDKVILKNTLFIAVWVLIFSCFMQGVFLVAGFWNYTVLLGNLLGDIVGIGNFFLLGLTVQKALKMEANKAKLYITWSKRIRMLLILIIAIVGGVISVFNTIALVISLIFPRLALLIYSIRTKKNMEQFDLESVDSVDEKKTQGTEEVKEIPACDNQKNTVSNENDKDISIDNHNNIDDEVKKSDAEQREADNNEQ